MIMPKCYVLTKTWVSEKNVRSNAFTINWAHEDPNDAIADVTERRHRMRQLMSGAITRFAYKIVVIDLFIKEDH